MSIAIEVKSYTVRDENGKLIANPKNRPIYQDHLEVVSFVEDLCKELGFVPENINGLSSDLSWCHGKDENLRIILTEDKNTLIVVRGSNLLDRLQDIRKIEFATYQYVLPDQRLTSLHDFVEEVVSSIRHFYTKGFKT